MHRNETVIMSNAFLNHNVLTGRGDVFFLHLFSSGRGCVGNEQAVVIKKRVIFGV